MAVNTQRASEQLSEISVADENAVLSRRAAQVQLGASPAQSKRRELEGNEPQAACAMKGVATVGTKLQKIGGSILALTKNNVNQLSSTEELKVSSDGTWPRRIRHCESLDLGDEDALTKLEELRVRVRTVGCLTVLGDRHGRMARIITSMTGDQHISHSAEARQDHDGAVWLGGERGAQYCWRRVYHGNCKREVRDEDCSPKEGWGVLNEDGNNVPQGVQYLIEVREHVMKAIIHAVVPRKMEEILEVVKLIPQPLERVQNCVMQQNAARSCSSDSRADCGWHEGHPSVKSACNSVQWRGPWMCPCLGVQRKLRKLCK